MTRVFLLQSDGATVEADYDETTVIETIDVGFGPEDIFLLERLYYTSTGTHAWEFELEGIRQNGLDTEINKIIAIGESSNAAIGPGQRPKWPVPITLKLSRE